MSKELLEQLVKRVQDDSIFRQQLRMSPRMILEEYDLTEDEKKELILPNFSWLIKNKIAGVSRPWSQDALILLKSLGVSALLSLTEEPLSSELLDKFELRAEHVPIADFSAPTIAQIEQAITVINGFLKDEIAVAVHCGAGVGRTGTILACYFVWQGISANEAISRVRTLRPSSIETPEQEGVIALYEHFRDTLPLT